MAGHVKIASTTMPQLQKGFEVPDGWVFHSVQPHPEQPNWFYVIMTDEEAVTF